MPFLLLALVVATAIILNRIEKLEKSIRRTQDELDKLDKKVGSVIYMVAHIQAYVLPLREAKFQKAFAVLQAELPTLSGDVTEEWASLVVSQEYKNGRYRFAGSTIIRPDNINKIRVEEFITSAPQKIRGYLEGLSFSEQSDLFQRIWQRIEK